MMQPSRTRIDRALHAADSLERMVWLVYPLLMGKRLLAVFLNRRAVR